MDGIVALKGHSFWRAGMLKVVAAAGSGKTLPRNGNCPTQLGPSGMWGLWGKGRLPLTLTQIAEGQVQSSADCVIRMNQIS